MSLTPIIATLSDIKRMDWEKTRTIKQETTEILSYHLGEFTPFNDTGCEIAVHIERPLDPENESRAYSYDVKCGRDISGAGGGRLLTSLADVKADALKHVSLHVSEGAEYSYISRDHQLITWDQLVFGHEYYVDSHLGGVFQVIYTGLDHVTAIEGEEGPLHLFHITSPGHERTLRFSDRQIPQKICPPSSLIYRWAHGLGFAHFKDRAPQRVKLSTVYRGDDYLKDYPDCFFIRLDTGEIINRDQQIMSMEGAA